MATSSNRRWEYHTVLLRRHSTDGWSAHEPEVLDEQLNRLGSEGWELVNVIPIPTTNIGFLAVFKR